MKFVVKSSKFGNKFFFVSNLSEWGPYCRKEYNKLWLKGNLLNKKENDALRNLRKILKKYKLANILLASVNQKSARKTLSNILPQKDILILESSLNEFSKRFNLLWQKEKRNLDLIKKNIFNNLPVFKDFFALIKILYKIKKEPQEIKIFLITNPILKRPISGGSGLGNNKISVECSKITKENNQNQIIKRVILHEIVHASFEENIKKGIENYLDNKYFKQKYEKIILKSSVYKQTHSILGPIKEMILVSLIPEGYLAEKFFNFDVIENLRKRKCIQDAKLGKNYYDLMLYSVYKLYPIAKKYCDNKKPIDSNYIEKVIQNWIEFEKTDLKKLKI